MVLSGLWLGWIAIRSSPPTYQPEPDSVPTDLSGEVPSGYRVASFEIDGMCCATCTGKLHAALSSVSGVREAAVDFDASSATVVVAETVADDLLLAALNVDKYSARRAP